MVELLSLKTLDLLGHLVVVLLGIFKSTFQVLNIQCHLVYLVEVDWSLSTINSEIRHVEHIGQIFKVFDHLLPLLSHSVDI